MEQLRYFLMLFSSAITLVQSRQPLQCKALPSDNDNEPKREPNLMKSFPVYSIELDSGTKTALTFTEIPLFVEEIENQFALNYPDGITSYPHTELKTDKPLKALTVCFWMKRIQTNFSNVFTYTESGKKVYMVIDSKQIKFKIYGSKELKIDFQQEILENTLTSICFTWDKDNDKCKLYQNSMLQKVSTGQLSSPSEILPGGIFHLGDGQDMAFYGNLSHFNMWSYVLPMEMITLVSQRCWAERGDVVSWDSFKEGASGFVEVVKDICPNQVPQWSPSNLLGHWPLDGPDKNISLIYSAAYLEGRYTRTRSLFLDSTKAHAEMPSYSLNGSFAIALWLKYTSSESRNATILSNWKSGGHEFVLRIFGDKIVFRRAHNTGELLFSREGLISVNKWHHVALVWNNEKSATKYQFYMYVDGMQYNDTEEYKQNWYKTNSITWDIGGSTDGWSYDYFLGYISDLMVFDRALSNEEIGKVMGVGIKRYSTDWEPKLPLVGNPSGIQTRTETSPDDVSCVNKRTFIPGDCLGALLTHHNTISVNNELVDVKCDQSTNGGGWLIIGRKMNSNVNFDRPNEEYAEMFGQLDDNFWLGSKTISAITKEPVQLLIEIQNKHGKISHSAYRYFKMEISKEKESTVRVAQYTGNAGDVLMAESSSNVVLLERIKNLFTNSSLRTVEMKIRPTEDLPSDYTLHFKSPLSVSDHVKVSNLTEISAFTMCLWIRVPVAHKGTLMSLVSEDVSCKLTFTKTGNAFKLHAQCGANEATPDFIQFDNHWHHVCFSWNGTSDLLMSYLNGRKVGENRGSTPHVIKRGGVLNLGRLQASLNDSSFQVANDFIGQLGHFDMWDYWIGEDAIIVYANGPGSESGNLVPWAVARVLVSGGINVIHPSSRLLKESYHWRFGTSNNTIQIDDNNNNTAMIDGTDIDAEEESLIIDKQGYVMIPKAGPQEDGLTMSFWIKQDVLISDILGDNAVYYAHIRKWLSPLVSYHASWIRCYSSKKDGWLVSTFHNNCDFKGPTITLIRVKDNVFGGMIDQNWGGTPGYFSSENAFLFTLENPHNISPSTFPIKNDQQTTAAQTSPFLGPSFGLKDLVVYEDTNGRVSCYSNLGGAYQIPSDESDKAEGNNIFTGSRWFYPDEIEVFYYDFSTSNVSHDIQNRSSSMDLMNGLWCSGANTVNQFIVLEFNYLVTVTHIAIQGLPDRHVTSFDVEYLTAKNSKLAQSKEWIKLTKEFVSRNQGRQTLHALMPPVRAYKVSIRPISWIGGICMKIEFFTFTTKACGPAFGMEDSRIPDERISASSTFSTFKKDVGTDEYRWPKQGRLKFERGWVQAQAKEDWFQIDLGSPQEIRCLDLQGVRRKKQFVTTFKISYSNNGSKWEFVQTDYSTNTYHGVTDSELTLFNPIPRSIQARFFRIHTATCNEGKTCGLRMELYGNATDSKGDGIGLEFFVRRGSNHVIYSTATKTWRIENQPKIVNWTHVTITCSSTNGLRMYYNGSLFNSKSLADGLVRSMQQPRILIGMTADDGLGNQPMKLRQMKVWNQELNEKNIVEYFESISCNFESDMCWNVSQSSSVSSWKRTLYCLSDNETGLCQDGSVTGYCLTLKSSSVSFGQSSVLTSPLLHSAYSCVSFSFRISGNKHVGRLNIYLIDSQGNRLLLWRLGGNHGKTWKNAKVPVKQMKPFRIEFEGIKGRDYEGYIAIDNITISVQACETLIPANAYPHKLAVKSSILDHSPKRLQNLKQVLIKQGLDSTSWTTCYTSHEHGWDATTFHSLCDMKGPTLLLARSENIVFGGATEQSWGRVFPDPDAYSLQFTSNEPKDYVIQKIPYNITALSLSLWMKTTTQSLVTLASANNDDFLMKYNVSVSSNPHVVVRLFSSPLELSHSLSDDVWHHISVQWENINGNCTIFIDGNLKIRGTLANSAGRIIPTGSSFFLGKGYTGESGFNGLLGHVNLWSSVIDEVMVKLLSHGCLSYHGNALAWPAFKGGIQGNVKVVPSRCEANKTVKDYEMLFNKSPNSGYVLLDSPWKSDLVQFTMSWWMKTESQDDLYLFSHVHSTCPEMSTLSLYMTLDRSSNRWQFSFKFAKQCSKNIIRSFNTTAPINDGYWHHVTATWSEVTGSLCLYVDGKSEGSEPMVGLNLTTGGKIILAQVSNTSTGDPNSVETYEGKLSGFNMWDYVMNDKAASILALACGAESGNLIQWENVRNGLIGRADVISPSSCPNGNYRPDLNAFLFVLHDADNSSTTTVRKEQAEVSTRDEPSRGMVFGDAPHDLIVGVNGNMNAAMYNRNVSYDAQIMENCSLPLDEVEVFHLKATMCSSTCPYKHVCDEINGGCECETADTSFGLCDIDKKFFGANYWPLDSPKAIKNLKGKKWGVGGAYVTSSLGVNGGSLKTNGLLDSHIKLGSYDATCLSSTCTMSIALWLKYFPAAISGQSQTFLDIQGIFTLYQPGSPAQLAVKIFTKTYNVCDYIFNATSQVWSHIFVTSDVAGEVRIYKNGLLVTEFVKSQCESPVKSTNISKALITLSKGGAVAEYDDLVIWNNTVLYGIQIKDIFKDYTERSRIPIKLTVKLTQEIWHNDLLNADSEMYHELFKKLQSNITNFYSGFNVSTAVKIYDFWQGSVMSNFTVSYYPWSPDLVLSLQNNMTTSSSISNMPSQLVEVSASQVPSSPLNVQAVASSASSIDVSWIAPDMDPITQSLFQGYYVYVRQDGVLDADRLTVQAPMTTTTVPNLQKDKGLQVWVSGYTIKGEGMPSSIINITISPPREPPQNFSGRPYGLTCVELTWQHVPPNIGDKALQGYRIFYSPTVLSNSSQLLSKTTDANQTALRICDLYMATNYTFLIRAFNDLDGPLSDPIIVLTTTDVPTEKPVITAAYNTSKKSIVVKWDKVSSSHNQSRVVAYEVLVYRNDSRFKPLYVMMVNCENVTIMGLDKYTAYFVTVAGVTRGGKGPHSDPVICMTDEDVPEGSPSSITLIDATSTSLNIKWEPIPVSTRFGIILGYTVVYYSLDESNRVVFNLTCTSCDQMKLNVTHLKPFRRYRVEIFGFNSKGNGPKTNTSATFRTMQAAPSTGPQLESAVNQSSTSVLIKWTPIPQENINGILQSYEISYQAAGSPAPQYRTFAVNQSTVPKRRRRRAIDHSSPQVLLDGLEKFTTYSVMVAGFTVAQGPFGSPINVTTDEDVPESPLLLKARNTSSTEILVTWKPPAKPNGIIIGYIVHYSEADNTSGSVVAKTQNVISTSITLSGLTNYTMYSISVAGKTSKGIGDYNTTACTTDEAAPTGPPQVVSAFAASTTSIEVKWQQVPLIQRRGIITHYKVQIRHYPNGSLVEERTIPGGQYITIFEGLGKLSNYTARVKAFTRIGYGPFSEDYFATTGVAAPKVPPGNVTAQLNGTTQILVKWSNLELHINGILRGYRIVYSETNHPFSSVRNVTVDNTKQEVLLTGLYYYTQYRIRVAGFTTSDGNYSEPVYTTTGEGVPGQPPSEIVLSNRGSREIGLYWKDVEPGYQNGKVIKYRAQYRKTVPVGETYREIEANAYSMVLPNLERSTTYEIKLAARTAVGYGNSSFHIMKTDEDVPSQAPPNLTAYNRTSLYSLPVTWEPVQQEYMHGVLTNYYLSYFIVQQGDKVVMKTEKVSEVILPVSQTWYNITGLLPLSVYRIEVAASTKKGTGPISITFGETCRCKKKLSTNWSQYKPYSNVSDDGRPGYIIPIMIEEMTSYCCKSCKEHGKSHVDFHFDGNGQKAEKKSLQELLLAIDGATDFSFPVYGYQDQTIFKGGLGYTPLIESPGVAFIVGKDSYNFKEQMFRGVLGCWPVLAIPIIMTCIAGFFVWFLDSMITTNKRSDFPKSFTKGVKEGIWWSFVSMTTVGYGDRTPRNIAGRIFAVGWTLTGIVIISVATSSLTTTLTEITIKAEKRLYGAQVAALQDGPEYLLGKRRNAYVNEKKKYYTLDEVKDALDNHDVIGILVDTYAAGSRTDLFNDPSLRVAKVLDYKMAYGLVTAGHAIKLRRCFRDYLNVHKVHIYLMIVDNVHKVKNRKYDPATTVSTGLFDPKAYFFKKSVQYTLATLLIFLIVGVLYECIRKLRLRARIDNQEMLRMITRKKEEMKGIVDEFKQKVAKVFHELVAKHKKEISYLKKMKKKTKKSFENYEEEISMEKLTQKDVCL